MPNTMVLALVLLMAGQAQARNNGLGRLPPLGWNTWCTWSSCKQDAKMWPNLTHAYHDVCTEEMVKDVAQSMIDQGLLAAGYNRVNLDDCWEATSRAEDGSMRADPDRFPSGTLKELADWLHDKGFLFGMYTSIGYQTCSTGGRTIPGVPDARGVNGSYGYYDQDARTFASWGVDYVKLDSCLGKGPANATDASMTPKFQEALNRTGRPMWLNFHCDGAYQPWCAENGNSWRIGPDHHDVWESTAGAIEILATVGENGQTGRYQWADPDFLMTGGAGCDTNITSARCPGQTEVEYRTEMSLWTIGAASILVATDLRQMTDFMRETLLNKEILAIHQDEMGVPGVRVGYVKCDENAEGSPARLQDEKTACQVWARPLKGGAVALALYNTDDKPHSFTVRLADVPGVSSGSADVRDVWAGKDIGTVSGKFAAGSIDSHATQVYKLNPAA